MTKCAIVYLEYLEPSWKATQACIDKCPHVTIKADRQGYLGIPRAFNKAFIHVPPKIPYVWFITNITFKRQDVDMLIEAMDKTGFAAISPVFDSDHSHLRPRAGTGVKEAPFVEFTCPIVRTEVFRDFPLDENMPYDIHDLDWSARVRNNGHKLGVHYGVEVGHVYLRNSSFEHFITKKRKKYRDRALPNTHDYAAKKWGHNWKEKIWPR